MTIVMTGGGSGGHVTPLLAVARAIKARQPDVRLVYIGQKKDPFSDMAVKSGVFAETHLISAGKFRRYHGHGILRQAIDIKTQFLNARDAFRTLRGIVQAYRKLRKIKPDVVFSKGGYVVVPVGLAAHWRGCRIVTHDSDAVPGLANRIIGRWASLYTVGMPEEYYPYERTKTRFVGNPIDAKYKFVDTELMAKYRQDLNLPADAPVLFVSGGGQGAKRINDAVLDIIEQLFAKVPELYILMGVGAANEDEAFGRLKGKIIPEGRVRIKGFITNQEVFTGAATVVISRAGASTTAELAMQGKPVIMIPSPVLAGGHQVKNASSLAASGAVRLVREESMNVSGQNSLLAVAVSLLTDESQRRRLSHMLHSLARPSAAEDTARYIVEVAGENEDSPA